ncbi:hypothetical protein IW261DRAFT_1428159 [Armillaria novae-zelandiae]|uniref:Uncharacterized protein n=1 Tax=Armillaria novae-zelandiae TaxID=153914 RepID=A0AA39NAV2_9AGAR|nr:hypothetical protein IW261DRAFT_1428159 [Armillaria novae-zelandiae]
MFLARAAHSLGDGSGKCRDSIPKDQCGAAMQDVYLGTDGVGPARAAVPYDSTAHAVWDIPRPESQRHSSSSPSPIQTRTKCQNKISERAYRAIAALDDACFGRARKENFPVHSNFNHIGLFPPPPCAEPVELHIRIHIQQPSFQSLSIRMVEVEANSLQDVQLDGAQLAHDEGANGMAEAESLESVREKADYGREEIKPSLQQRMGINGTMGQFSQAMATEARDYIGRSSPESSQNLDPDRTERRCQERSDVKSGSSAPGALFSIRFEDDKLPVGGRISWQQRRRAQEPTKLRTAPVVLSQKSSDIDLTLSLYF